MQPVLLILKRLIFDSGIVIGVDSTTSERRYLVQSLDLHDRIRNHSERVAERALKGTLERSGISSHTKGPAAFGLRCNSVFMARLLPDET